MNKTLWKLEHASERIWLIASSIAMEASKLGREGRGFAVVAEETRTAAIKINSWVEKAIFEGEEINQKSLIDLAAEVNYLALNAAIEANRRGQRGKIVTICAEDIRNITMEIIAMLDDKKRFEHTPPPFPSKIITSVKSNSCFMQFNVNGYRLIENLDFICEVTTGNIDHSDTHVILRGTKIPIVDCYSLLGVKNSNTSYSFIIVQTPWAETNERYAVAVDDGLNLLFYCQVGVPIAYDSQLPLAKYVRECWESTDGEPFRFMDWAKMIQC